MPASYSAFFVIGMSITKIFGGSYGKDDNIYGGKDFKTIDSLCDAGAFCAVFAGDVRSS